MVAQRWYDDDGARTPWADWLARVTAADPTPRRYAIGRLARSWQPLRAARRAARARGSDTVLVIVGTASEFIAHVTAAGPATTLPRIDSARAVDLVAGVARRVDELELHDRQSAHDLVRGAASVALGDIDHTVFPDSESASWARRTHKAIRSRLSELGVEVRVAPRTRRSHRAFRRPDSERLTSSMSAGMLATATGHADPSQQHAASSKLPDRPRRGLRQLVERARWAGPPTGASEWSEADVAARLAGLVRDLDSLPDRTEAADHPPSVVSGVRRMHAATRRRLRALADEVVTLLPEGNDRIAVIGDAVDPRLVDFLSTVGPADSSARSRTVVVPARDPAQRHLDLTGAGPFGLILDLAGRERRRATLLDCFYHLSPGGRYVVPDGAAEFRQPKPARATGAIMLKHALARQRAGLPARIDFAHVRAAERARLGLAYCLAGVETHGKLFCLLRRNDRVRVKLRERDATRLFAHHPEYGYRTIETIDPVPFTPKAPYRTGRDVGVAATPREIRQPPISLREYTGVVVAPGQVIADGHLLMPDTFRHNSRPKLLNRRIDDIAPRFAGLTFDDADVRPLPGTYFHLDNEVRGHFGHLLTEQVARFWAWPRIREEYPGIKVLVGTHPSHRRMHDYEFELLAAGGIERDDIVLLDGPVRVDRLFSGTQMLSNPDYVHPRIIETWDRVGDRLTEHAVGGPRPERVFCSRKNTRRVCQNAAELETLFAERGFEVIYPEEFNLGDQIEIFRAAKVVAGFAGSGLFNLCFATEPTRVVMIGGEAYSPRNEMLIGALRGHETDAVQCASEGKGLLADFWFDADREGRYLNDVLDNL